MLPLILPECREAVKPVFIAPSIAVIHAVGSACRGRVARTAYDPGYVNCNLAQSEKSTSPSPSMSAQ